MSNIVPVTFRILLKPYLVEEQDEAYKIAKRLNMDMSQEKKLEREQAAVDQGVVVSFGPTAFEEFGCPNPLKVGDEIVFARHAGKEVVDPVTKEKFVIINDSDVVAILRKEA